MSRDLTGTWMVSSLSPPDGVDLMYVAVALSDSFRKDMKRLIAAGKAATEVYGSTGLTLKTWCSATYWLHSTPSNHEYFLELDAGDWLEMRIPPMAELSMEPEEVQKVLDNDIDAVTARTDCEQVEVGFHGGEPSVHFSAYEKHGETKVGTSALPAYVLEWILAEDDVSA